MRIAAYRGISLVSKLIQWQTRSPYSHIALVMDAGDVFEAWEGCGVSHPNFKGGLLYNLSENHTKGTEIDIFTVEGMTPEKEATARAFLDSQVGKKYDFVSVFRFLDRRDVTHHDQYKWFCSEYAFECCRIIGIDLLLRILSAEVSPGELARSPLLKMSQGVVTI